MSRAEIAYLLIVLMIASFAAVVVLSRRFARYQRAVTRGERETKRVWRPFWTR